MYLLDTNVVSELRRPKPHGGVVACLCRSPSPSDRRVKLLELAPAGRQTVQEVEAAVERVQERLLAPLAAEHWATLMRLLAQPVNLHNEIAPTPLGAAQ